MRAAKLLLASLLWPVAYVLLAVPWLLGHLVVPILAALGRWHIEAAPLSDGEPVRMLRDGWARIWANPEDHFDGPRRVTSPSVGRWAARAAGWPTWRRAWSWSAVRNSVAWERMLYRPTVDGRVSWIGSPHVHEEWKAWREVCGQNPIIALEGRWFLCWARFGWRAGLWIRRGHRDGTYSEIRLGWKIIPRPPRERERYAGLGLQAHVRRDG